MKFTKQTRLRGEVTIPGDKSVSHRSVMFGSIAKGTTEIHNYLQGADCLSTIACLDVYKRQRLTTSIRPILIAFKTIC